MEKVELILRTVLYIFGILASYQVILIFVGLLFPSKKFKKTDKLHSYAVIIAARNEDKVIAQLIKSIKNQDYPPDKLDIFVVADNCTDKTAAVAREAGAIVYERINPPQNRRRKGYAVQFLLQQIEKDYEGGIKKWDGVLMFDADNLLAENWVTEMNKAFADRRYDFFNSYINIKNIGTNIISAYSGCGLIGGICNRVRPVSLIGISNRIRGRGIAIRSELLSYGWNWCSLAEDGEFSAHFIARGYRGSYCEAAQMYDEQPLTLKILIRQRMRWVRGWFNCFFMYGPLLVLGIFLPRDWGHRQRRKELKSKRGKVGVGAKTAESLLKRLSCYDNFISLFPMAALTFVYGFLYPLTATVISLFTGASIMPMVTLVLTFYAVLYIYDLLNNLVTIIREHKHMRVRPLKLLKYVLIFPLFSAILQYTSLFALFLPVKWKAIPHVDTKSINDVLSEKTLAEHINENKSFAESVNKK